jgi:hypothetical protein
MAALKTKEIMWGYLVFIHILIYSALVALIAYADHFQYMGADGVIVYSGLAVASIASFLACKRWAWGRVILASLIFSPLALFVYMVATVNLLMRAGYGP